MNINETRSQLEIMNGNKMQEKKVWKLVLTGGPCGGKTTGETEIIFLFQCRLEDYFFLFLIKNNYLSFFSSAFLGQIRLSTFFENLGWKVYRVPETANILLSGGVKFETMNEDAQEKFQENLLKTMMQIEQSFFDLATSSSN